MATVAEIQQQQQVAKDAYRRGEITWHQYELFMRQSEAQKQQVIASQSQSRRRVISSKVAGGDTKKRAVAGGYIKKAPKKLKTVNKTSPLSPPREAGDWQPISKAPPKVQEQAKERTKAVEFYASVGRPELAMKYGAPDIESDQVVVKVEEVKASTDVSPLPPEDFSLHKPAVEGDWVTKEGKTVGKDQLRVTTMPKMLVHENVSFFGVQSLREPTPEEEAEIERKYLAGELQTTTLESKALTGLGLSTVMATGVTAPVLGAVGVTSVGVGEAVKVGVTGEHLTVEEAVGIAGVSMAASYLAYKAYPYVKSGVSKIINRISPERAMYNRVVLEQFGEGTPAGTQSWSEKIVAKISPERAMYNRVVKGVQPTAKTPTTPTNNPFTGGGTTVSKPSTSGWAQQQLVKPATTTKATLKPYTAPQTLSLKSVSLTSLTVKTPKTKTVTKTMTVQKQASKIVFTQPSTRQVQNPFLQYGGKPYYRGRAREYEYVYPIVYPGQSPLQAPSSLSASSVLQSPKQAEALEQFEKSGLMPEQAQASAQVPSQLERQEQVILQEQTQTTIQLQDTPQTPRTPQVPSVPYIPFAGGGTSLFPSRFNFSRWYPRTHKVKTWQEQAGDLGFKVPKGLSSLGSAEGFGDLGKTLKPKTKKKRKRRRTKRKR